MIFRALWESYSLSQTNNNRIWIYTIKGDLRTLKFGYALLHQSHEELSEESRRQLYKLKHIQDTLDEHGGDLDNLDALEMQIEEAVESIETTIEEEGADFVQAVSDAADALKTQIEGFVNSVDQSIDDIDTVLEAVGSDVDTVVTAVGTLESQHDDIEDGVDELRSSDHPCGGTGWMEVANIILYRYGHSIKYMSQWMDGHRLHQTYLWNSNDDCKSM